MTETNDDNRVRQIAVGAGILGILTLLVCGGLLGWGYLPGFLGQWVGTMVGVVTTPFIMEATFVILGLMIVVGINHWRRKREGDDFVYLEQVEGAEEAGVLPEHAKFAVYREPPLPGETPTLLAQVEGAMAIGDHEAAGEALSAMSERELKQPEVLFLRLELARATGRDELAGRLEEELRIARCEAR